VVQVLPLEMLGSQRQALGPQDFRAHAHRSLLDQGSIAQIPQSMAGIAQKLLIWRTKPELLPVNKYVDRTQL
jgi:hypothetical protein